MKIERENFLKIIEYVRASKGLDGQEINKDRLKIIQRTDGKSLELSINDIDKVIPRLDVQGKEFLQVNFQDDRKILITENLVGFKPYFHPDMDMEKLPRVVTTPDLVSVVEAIMESLNSESENIQEVDLLRRVFGSVLEGGEAVGFDLSGERHWMCQIANLNKEHSA